MATLLQVSGLTTHFFTDDGTVEAVDDVSFTVGEGEIVGVVGESGCGKSVSALSIVRLVPDPPGKIVAGEVIFDNQNLLELSDAQMRKIRGNRIGMIFQEPMTSLNPVLTVGKQITEVLELHLKMSKNAALERAQDLLDMVGIPDPQSRLSDYPHQMSGGMRQRVMIAMAISCNPRLIIADEPTTALDVTIQAQILELMQRLSEELGTAMIIITHNLGIVARYAERVVVMYAGNVVEEGTSRQIYYNSHHPYTLGLLDSVPRLDDSDGISLRPIDGLPPDLIGLGAGCKFSPRCLYAIGKCVSDTPSLKTFSGMENQHQSKCWRAEDIVDMTMRVSLGG